MDVMELIVGNRVVVATDPNTKEIGVIKAILPDGRVLVRYCNGKLMAKPSTSIIKMFDK